MGAYLTEVEMKNIFERFPEYSKIKTFIETGTFKAETISNMCRIFPSCHTIELSEELYAAALEKHNSKGIHFHLGDSVQILGKLIPNIDEPAVFFLDAHWCGRESGKGKVDVPLIEEICLIAERPYKDLVIIDDCRLFSTNDREDWSNITVRTILNNFGKKIPFWKKMLPFLGYRILNDRMIVPL